MRDAWGAYPKPKSIEVRTPIKIDSLTELFRIRGVPVYFHWTVLLICGLIIFNVIRNPLASLLVFAAYISVLLVHESGHLIAAQLRHSEVVSIHIYPIFGITRFETPWSRFDHCIIAWGGVIAQAVVALPVVMFIVLFGYTRFEPLNAVMVILGFFSLGVAAINLLPISRLDGATAWAIIPEGFKRISLRATKRRR
jgi:Zn-dependent protease